MAEESSGGEGRSDVLFIVLVIVFLIVAWFLSGAARGANVGTLFTSFPGSTYTSTTSQPTIGVPSVSPGSDAGGFDESETDVITEEVAAVRKELALLSARPSSPYSGKVSITSAWGGRHTSAKSEYVVIRASQNNSGPVVISNWRIESAVSGRTAYIRNGIEVYQQGLGANSASAIVLEPGDEAIVSTGRSPIGTSFRINKCSEYLTQFQEIIPPLSTQCPTPADEAADFAERSVYTDNACLDHLDTLQACRIDVTPPTTLSEGCRSFIFNTLTYQGCVNGHQGDYNFKTTQWRVYLGYDESLWREKREVLALIDEQGKLVDSTTY